MTKSVHSMCWNNYRPMFFSVEPQVLKVMYGLTFTASCLCRKGKKEEKRSNTSMWWQPWSSLSLRTVGDNNIHSSWSMPYLLVIFSLCRAAMIVYIHGSNSYQYVFILCLHARAAGYAGSSWLLADDYLHLVQWLLGLQEQTVIRHFVLIPWSTCLSW